MRPLTWLILILFTGRGDASQISILEPSAFCQLMLTPGAAQTQRLSDSVLAQIGEQLNQNKISGQFSYMQDMRDVMAELVKAGTITQAQAEMLFAERVLGHFSRIFLKYTFAELMERGFSNEDIVQFVLHFDDVYNASKQVEFAIDVSRRMLLSLNEETGIQSAQGLKAFLSFARAFGIPAQAYSNFLQLWVHIRAAHPGTIVHFILSNIKNAGHALREQIDQANPAPTALAETRKQPRWWAWSPSPPGKLSPAVEAVTRELLDLDSIPESIRHPHAEFTPNTVTYDSFLDRFWAQTDTDLPQYLDDLEQRPPFAREFIIYHQLSELTFARLEQFVQTPLYQILSAETRRRGDQILVDFKRLRDLEERLKSFSKPSLSLAPARTPTINSDAISDFERNLAYFWARLGRHKCQRDVHDLILKSYTLTKTRFKDRLGSEDFLSIASKLLNLSMAHRELEQVLGELTALEKISRDFELDAKQLGELDQILNRQSVLVSWTSSPKEFREVPALSSYLKATIFGRAKPEQATSTNTNTNTTMTTGESERREVLTEIRELLLRYGIRFKDLKEIHERIANPKIPKSVNLTLPLTQAPQAYRV